jgi:hypothetical protein
MEQLDDKDYFQIIPLDIIKTIFSLLFTKKKENGEEKKIFSLWDYLHLSPVYKTISFSVSLRLVCKRFRYVRDLVTDDWIQYVSRKNLNEYVKKIHSRTAAIPRSLKLIVDFRRNKKESFSLFPLSSVSIQSLHIIFTHVPDSFSDIKLRFPNLAQRLPSSLKELILVNSPFIGLNFAQFGPELNTFLITPSRSILHKNSIIIDYIRLFNRNLKELNLNFQGYFDKTAAKTLPSNIQTLNITEKGIITNEAFDVLPKSLTEINIIVAFNEEIFSPRNSKTISNFVSRIDWRFCPPPNSNYSSIKNVCSFNVVSFNEEEKGINEPLEIYNYSQNEFFIHEVYTRYSNQHDTKFYKSYFKITFKRVY